MEIDVNKIIQEIKDFLRTGKEMTYSNSLDKSNIKTLDEIIQEHIKENQKIKVSNLLNYSNLGDKFKERTFENFKININNNYAYTTAKKYADAFDTNVVKGKGIIFLGSYGVGKTHLACSIANELIHNNHTVIFGSFIKLMANVKQSYNNEITDKESKIIQSYCNCDLLILDDLGKERISEWSLEKLYYIINERYENNKPIIITTNFNDKELTSRLTIGRNKSTAEALISRLAEMCMKISIVGNDHRLKNI